MSLKGKVIVVTGGTGILGGSFIDAICGAEAKVGILGRNASVAAQRAAEINKKGGSALALVADVLDEAQLVAAREKILQEFGAVHGLVNAAGGNMPEGILQPDENIFEMNLSGMQRVAELNLWGTLLPTQVFGKAIVDAGGGSIVNISSMSSQRAITKVLGYSLGKAGIDCYTKWFAVELANRYGDKIRMNAIAPGFFLTEQNRTLLTNEDNSYTQRGNLVIGHTPMKRFGIPEELNGALLWLLGEESRFVTGTIINIDGGFSTSSGV
ncbi:SDR family oxidoreductase [Pedobacter sp. GR22-6]|uniref:SDR family oxidoreductase n=1 Tax=Pedobacter sp. GR22-6 TaxID=3127957 RepID=UPI00307D2111